MIGSTVTVAVATCGRPGALARCLAAIAAQSESPAEVIVVDQAPSPVARRVVEDGALGRARYLEQPRLGLSASRNLALRAAATPYLAVTDDDCAPDPDWLALLAAALTRFPEPTAATGRILPLGESPEGSFSISLRKDEDPVDYRGRILPWVAGSGANFAARVDALHAARGWDERLGTGSPGRAAEDSDLLDRILARGGVVRFEPGAVVRHDWQTRERRLATRWSYGYGIGAMCGLRIARGDRFALDMLTAYARLQVRPLLKALYRRERFKMSEHARTLASLLPGVAYGLRSSRRPRLRSAGP